MDASDQFTDAQREIVRREVNRHAIAAYERGIAEGKRLAGPVAIANWIKEAAKSWTMAGGAAAVAAGVAGQLWPVVAELLDRTQHADLADALRQYGETVYAASWAAKDAL